MIAATAARPLVSVIIPVYNGAPYLAEAIESVFAQSYRTLELIVIDDGSTDASWTLIGHYASRLRAYRQPNRGTGAARNRGVALARGSLLAFLDQDDLWTPDKLAAQVEVLRAEAGTDAIFGMVTQFPSPELDESFRQRMSYSDIPMPGYLPSAMLIRRSAFRRIGNFDEGWQLVEWSEWFVRAIEQGLAMTMLPSVVARRRLHQGNKGLALRDSRHEYPRILKAMLDRRRARQGALAGRSATEATSNAGNSSSPSDDKR